MIDSNFRAVELASAMILNTRTYQDPLGSMWARNVLTFMKTLFPNIMIKSCHQVAMCTQIAAIV